MPISIQKRFDLTAALSIPEKIVRKAMRAVLACVIAWATLPVFSWIDLYAQEHRTASTTPPSGADLLLSEQLLMPLPTSMERGSGAMPLDGNFLVLLDGYQEPRLNRAVERIRQRIARKTGLIFIPQRTGANTTLTVRVSGASKPVQELGEDEAYTLTVTPSGALLQAANPLGALRGLQTFLQLIHPANDGFVVDSVVVRDRPRFPWRGFMLDSSRHFQPVPQVLQQLDAMEIVKMNVFHWHLSDDQGFRVESMRYPKLQEMGSDGNFYTQEQIRQVVEYARDRGIRVVPEFDMPAHTRSWFVGYPELAALPGPYSVVHHYTPDDFLHPDPKQDGVIDPTKEETYQFLANFLAEMTALFPDRYFHIGGDECDGKQWDAAPQVQAFKKARHLKDNAALQAYFTNRVQGLVSAQHKTAVGWDEVLQPDTPKDVVIQSWRGQRSLFQAASRGYRGILSAGYYLDLNQPASQHYLADPTVLPPVGKDEASAIDNTVPEHLFPDQEARILGGEAAEWTEYITPEILSNRVWPRAAAVAERLWSPQADRDIADMYARLDALSHELAVQGIGNGEIRRDMLQRLAGAASIDRLTLLATMVQPPLEYQREELPGQAYDEIRPLIHMADAIPAESEPARLFADLAHAIAAGKATPEQYAELRRRLLSLVKNDEELRPTLQANAFLAELQEVSANLAQTATIGLEALDRIEGSAKVTGSSAAAQQEALKRLARLTPAALRNMAAAPVAELVAHEP